MAARHELYLTVHSAEASRVLISIATVYLYRRRILAHTVMLSTAAFNGGNFSVDTRRDRMHVYPEAISIFFV